MHVIQRGCITHSQDCMGVLRNREIGTQSQHCVNSIHQEHIKTGGGGGGGGVEGKNM